MRTVRCPTCGVLVDRTTAPERPFCSERCRLVDLEGWANGRYRIPGDPVPPPTDPGDEA